MPNEILEYARTAAPQHPVLTTANAQLLDMLWLGYQQRLETDRRERRRQRRAAARRDDHELAPIESWGV